MPSSDDADKKKAAPASPAVQETSELEVLLPDAASGTGPKPLARHETTASGPAAGAASGRTSDAVPEVTRIDDVLDEAIMLDGPPGDATAELSQEQIDALPALQRHKSASEPDADGRRPSVQSDAWGSFEENSAWMSNSQTGRRLRPSAGDREAPPADALLEPEPDLEPSPGGSAAERPVPARLVSVQAGDGRRQEFALRKANVRLGRGSANQIIIDNPSVSREHARLTWQRGEWTVHDLQSGNGIFVNQQRVAGARALRHGDEVMFGQTVWQFAVESVGVPPMPPVAPAPYPVASTADVETPKPNRSRLITPILLVLVAVLVAGVFVVPKLRSREKGREIDPDAAAFAALKEGIAAFKAHKWEAADHDFAKVMALNPQDMTARNLQKALERERAAEQQLQQAHEAQAKGDLVAAYQLTSGVLDSTFRREAQAFLASLQTELDGRVQQAQKAFDTGKLTHARDLLQSVEEAQPGRPDVAILQVRLALRTTSAKTPVHLATLGKNRQMPPLSGPTAVAVRYFIDGDVAHALEMFESLNSEEAATLRQAVQRFSDAYDNALNEYRSKRAAAAIRLLNQAKSEEARISHGQCKLVNDIDHKLADMYYIQGVQQFAANMLPACYQSLHTAVTLVPTHALASRKLAELDQKARDILEGSGGNRATRAQLQLILQIVPMNGELYRKAKTRLDALP